MLNHPGLLFLMAGGILVLAMLILGRSILLFKSRHTPEKCPRCETRLRLYRATPNQRLWASVMWLRVYRLACPVCGYEQLRYGRLRG